MSNRISEQVFNLQFVASELKSSSSTCLQEERTEHLKAKRAMQDGNLDGAAIYAQNAIRKHQESLRHLKLSSRLEATVSKLETQIRTNSITTSLKHVVRALERGIKLNNLDAATTVMDSFDAAFKTLDSHTEKMDASMQITAEQAAPDKDVQELLSKIAEEHGLDAGLALPKTPNSVIAKPGVATVASIPPTAAGGGACQVERPAAKTEEEICDENFKDMQLRLKRLLDA